MPIASTKMVYSNRQDDGNIRFESEQTVARLLL